MSVLSIQNFPKQNLKGKSLRGQQTFTTKDSESKCIGFWGPGPFMHGLATEAFTSPWQSGAAGAEGAWFTTAAS